MKKKKRRLKISSLIAIIVLSFLLFLVIFFLTNNLSFIGKKSVHSDAKAYKTRHCLIFYPDSKTGLDYAKEMCKGVKDDSIYDYQLIPYGDYYQVSYGGDNRYFVDKDFNNLEINEISDEGKTIILDYLRYSLKKNSPEKYYNSKNISSINIESIDFSTLTYSINNEYLRVNIPQHEIDIDVPLKYMQKQLNMNFGYRDELYSKPTYLDTSGNHPIICITFDDGPEFWDGPGESSTEKIIDLLYKYDATATFYVVGTNLENRDTWSDYQAYNLLKRSINQGNEYGSHTQTHKYELTELSTADEIRKEINGPIDYLYKFLEYKVNTYRPVQGVFNQNVLDAQPLGAILWDVDSEDWLSMDPETIYNRIMSVEYEDGDILIFHDIYDETYEALERIIPELIDQGCQLVTVSEMLKGINIDVNKLSYYYGPGYYE